MPNVKWPIIHERKKSMGVFDWSLVIGHWALPEGFTLVELIIVIALIGILATSLIQIIDPISQLRKANDGQRKSDLAQLQRALELYYQDNGNYPASNNYKITIMKAGQPVSLQWGKDSWTPYMTKLPSDPKLSQTYIYYSNGQTYYLYASLERGAADPQACNAGNACTSMSGAGIPNNACGGTCNFGLSSPNVTP